MDADVWFAINCRSRTYFGGEPKPTSVGLFEEHATTPKGTVPSLGATTPAVQLAALADGIGLCAAQYVRRQPTALAVVDGALSLTYSPRGAARPFPTPIYTYLLAQACTHAHTHKHLHIVYFLITIKYARTLFLPFFRVHNFTEKEQETLLIPLHHAGIAVPRRRVGPARQPPGQLLGDQGSGPHPRVRCHRRCGRRRLGLS